MPSERAVPCTARSRRAVHGGPTATPETQSGTVSFSLPAAATSYFSQYMKSVL